MHRSKKFVTAKYRVYLIECMLVFLVLVGIVVGYTVFNKSDFVVQTPEIVHPYYTK